MGRYFLSGLMFVMSLSLIADRFLDLELTGAVSAPKPDPRIAAIVAEVSASNETPERDSFEDFLSALPADEGAKRGYYEDGTAQEDLIDARNIIKGAMVDILGARNVVTQKFRSGAYVGVNIVGVLPGKGAFRSQYYVICAHYDSAENAGADDDGSGVAGLLEAARVLSEYKFSATIVFVALDQEEGRENGFAQGSLVYAKQAKRGQMKIKGMVAMDMIAFHQEGENVMSLSRCDKKRSSASAALVNDLNKAAKTYTDLSATLFTNEDSSDPIRFYQYGFPAALVSEQYASDGWPVNPYYHEADDFFLDKNGDRQQCDGRNYIDSEYAAEVIRSVVAWVAIEAKLLRK